MSKARAPRNFFVNNKGNTNFLVWDKVNRDITHNLVNIVSYYIYKTANPSANDWGSPYGIVNTSDNYIDTDVFFIDFDGEGNYLYRVCPVDDTGVIGECTKGFGIVGAGTITTPTTAEWDLSGWDISIWA